MPVYLLALVFGLFVGGNAGIFVWFVGKAF